MIEKQQHKIDWILKENVITMTKIKRMPIKREKNYKIEFQNNLILKDKIEKKMIKQSILSQLELTL
jgi:hypothetical protein